MKQIICLLLFFMISMTAEPVSALECVVKKGALHKGEFLIEKKVSQSDIQRLKKGQCTKFAYLFRKRFVQVCSNDISGSFKIWKRASVSAQDKKGNFGATSKQPVWKRMKAAKERQWTHDCTTSKLQGSQSQ